MSHLIKLPDFITSEFVKNLKKGDVAIYDIGTFSVTLYKKRSHPEKNGDGYIHKKGKKLSRINFKPDPSLKEKVK
jgi:hypothetical protein